MSNGDRLRVTRGSGNVADMSRLTALDAVLPLAARLTVLRPESLAS